MSALKSQDPRSAVVIFLTAIPFLALAAAGCVTDIGDPVCTPDSVATDKDDSCPYGAPGGPKPELRPPDPQNQDECDGIQPVVNPADCTQTWAEHVFPAFQDPVILRCTQGGCHGNAPGADNFHMPNDDPAIAYANLTAYRSPDNNKPYLDPKQLPDSYILCNLRGDHPSPMPPSAGISVSDPNYTIIASWAACGAPLTGVGGPPQ